MAKRTLSLTKVEVLSIHFESEAHNRKLLLQLSFLS